MYEEKKVPWVKIHEITTINMWAFNDKKLMKSLKCQ